MALTVGLPFLERNKTGKNKKRRTKKAGQTEPLLPLSLHPAIVAVPQPPSSMSCPSCCLSNHSAPTLLCPSLTKSGDPKARSGIEVKVRRPGWAVVGEDGGGGGFGFRASPLRGADSPARRPLGRPRTSIPMAPKPDLQLTEDWERKREAVMAWRWEGRRGRPSSSSGWPDPQGVAPAQQR